MAQTPVPIYVKTEEEVFDVTGISNVPCHMYIQSNKTIRRIVGTLPACVENITIWWNDLLEEVSIDFEENSRLHWITISRNSLLTQINIQPPETVIALDYNSNKITKLPVLPPNLVMLNCSHNPIRELPAIPNTIRNLNFGNTNIQEFPELPKHIENMFLVWWGTSIKPENTFGKNLKQCYKKWQSENVQKSITRHKERCAKFLEDLMIKTWETKRMFDWCLDKEEQEGYGL
jgi:hypothetical protein